MSNAPTTARAVPLFVPTSASWPESPPTMKITPMMRLLMQSSEATGDGHDRGGGRRGARASITFCHNYITFNNFPHRGARFQLGRRKKSTTHQNPFLLIGCG